MRNLKDRTLSHFVWLSWVISGVVAVVAAAGVFLMLAFFDYRNANIRQLDELERISNVAARRLSAEIMLGANGEVEAVTNLLENQFTESKIAVLDIAPCEMNSGDSCQVSRGSRVEVYRKIPSVSKAAFVKTAQTKKAFVSFLDLKLLFWGALPIFLTLMAGVFIQRYFLKKYLVAPIEALVGVAEHRQSIPDSWPREFKVIASGLATAYEEHEQAVFAMFVKGVIHDIRTFLHSIFTASEMVNEQAEGTAKRAARLEHLQTACITNLQKIKRIVDQTLDGRRDIDINVASSDLIATVHEALISIKGQAQALNVKVDVDISQDRFLSVHDTGQLERALTNIIKNGVEAAAFNGSGRSSRVSVRMSEVEDKVSISIEDSGAGVDVPSDQLFKPLRSKKAHGTGLGLYVSRKIVAGHGGAIDVLESESLGGAKFVVTIPRNGAASEVRL